MHITTGMPLRKQGQTRRQSARQDGTQQSKTVVTIKSQGPPHLFVQVLFAQHCSHVVAQLNVEGVLVALLSSIQGNLRGIAQHSMTGQDTARHSGR